MFWRKVQDLRASLNRVEQVLARGIGPHLSMARFAGFRGSRYAVVRIGCVFCLPASVLPFWFGVLAGTVVLMTVW